jgi:cell division protein FtsW
MWRGRLAVLLLAVPSVGLGALGLAVVASASGHSTVAGAGAPAHFAVRQLIGLGVGALLGVATGRFGTRRVLHVAPALLVAALLATSAVFLPGIGVRAAGASRWLHLGPLSGNPAPFLIGAIGILVASSMCGDAPGPLGRTPLAVAGGLLGVLLLVAEPDFSSAAVALAVAFAALAGGGVSGRRWVPAGALLLIALAVGASRFGYVGDRIHGFLAPERDRRGKGFEVLQLAHTNAGLSTRGVGLGRGTSRRHLSSPASDYVYALVGEELGRRGALAVVAAWVSIGAGAALAIRSARHDPAARAVGLAMATALLAPTALHIAVCRGLVPIVGVTMPLLSYDPALTVASGGELGLLASIALGGASGDTGGAQGGGA